MNKIGKKDHKIGKKERDFLACVIAEWVRTGQMPQRTYTSGPRGQARNIIHSLQFAASKANAITPTRAHRVETLRKRVAWNIHIATKRANDNMTHAIPYKANDLIAVMSVEVLLAEEEEHE